MSDGLAEFGVARERIHSGLSQEDAVRLGVSLVDKSDDLLAIFYTEANLVLRQLEAAFAAHLPAQLAREAAPTRPVERVRASG